MRTDFAQLRRLPDLLFPRRCPFCGSLLGPDALQGTVCPACVPEEMRLQHIPARLPEGETVNPVEFYKKLYAKMDELKMPRPFTSRSVNDGFSGGEKKRCDILQMLMLEPSFAILDETDSGLDIDALRIVSEGVNTARGANIGMLLITHYHRLLEYIKPDRVHVMSGGRIVKSGGAELALELEQKGYDWLKDI